MLEWTIVSFSYAGYPHDSTDLYIEDMCEYNGDIAIVGSIYSGYTSDGSSDYSLFRYDVAEQTLELIKEGDLLTGEISSLVAASTFHPDIFYTGISKVWVQNFYGDYYLHFNFTMNDVAAPTTYQVATWTYTSPTTVYHIASVTYKLDVAGGITELYNTLDNYVAQTGSIGGVQFVYFQRYSYICKTPYSTAYFNISVNFDADSESRALVHVGPFPGCALGRTTSQITHSSLLYSKVSFLPTGVSLTSSELPTPEYLIRPTTTLPYVSHIEFLSSQCSISSSNDAASRGINTQEDEYILQSEVTFDCYMSEYNYTTTDVLMTEIMKVTSITGGEIKRVTYTHSTEVAASPGPESELYYREAASYDLRAGMIKSGNYYLYADNRKVLEENLFVYKPWANYDYTKCHTELASTDLLEVPFPEETYPAYVWYNFYMGCYPDNSIQSCSLSRTKYDDDLTGQITLFDGDTFIASNVSKTNLVTDIDRGVQTTGGLFVLSESVLYVLALTPNYHIKPTSITVDFDTIHIGGQSVAHFTTLSGVYLASGVQNFINPMYVNTLLPEVTSVSGDYSSVVLPRYRRIGYSGELYVKRYNLYESFIYGDINPFRAALAGRSSFLDLSYNIPSGIISTSVALDSKDYLTTDAGVIYSSTASGDSWNVYSTTDPIRTSHLSSLGEFFVTTPGGTYSVEKANSVLLPTWEKADTGLPAGAVVLDLEEDYYADR